MLKLYGADLSSYSNKVRFTLKHLGIPYQYKRISLRDQEHKNPDFKRLHPASKIPVIDDEGFILFESNAIIKYLAQKTESALYPADSHKRALIDQWMDFTTIHVGSAIDRIAFNRVFAPRINAPVDERSVKTGVSFLSRFLPVIDTQLKKTGFLVYRAMSLADINLLATLDPCEVAEINLAKYQHIILFLKEMRKRNFYTECHFNYKEKVEKMFSTPVQIMSVLKKIVGME